MVRIPKLLLTATLWVPLAATLDGAEWPHYARDPARSAITNRAARDLDTLRWSVSPAPDEEYVWRSGPVVHDGYVFINARHYDPNNVQDGNLLIAYDVFDGARRWATPIEIDVWDSWSSPAVDVRNQTVLLGSGQTLYALDSATGVIAWQTPLEKEVVNASPVVSTDLSNNGTPANRVFITDYSGFGTDGTLYAINVDPSHPLDNPYEPGQIVWTARLPGTCGNTPAYADGIVYVASTGGTVAAFHGLDGSPVWENPIDLSGYPPYSGFYGGLCIRNGFVYAALYVFYGTGNNAGLFKLDAADGHVVWVAPCERSASIPVVTDDGRIYLSAGLAGFGSAVKVQAFQDHGQSVALLWDTHADTGGELVVGGWTHQLVYARGYLYTGTPRDEPDNYFLPYTDLYILDASTTPDDPCFIVAHCHGTGGSPAMADGTLYSIGEDGLLAFEPSPACLADLDADGLVGLSDLATLLGAYRTARGEPGFISDADLNRDGRVDLVDLAALLAVYGEACP